MTTKTSQTELAARLRISEEEAHILASIFSSYLADQQIFAFGSRATGKHLWRFSDLDLAITNPLSNSQHAAVTEALDDSMLTFAVDLVELPRLDPDFRSRIEPDLIRLA
jgi:predicted nucleotidyltransferase